jgi:hypothetical protein
MSEDAGNKPVVERPQTPPGEPEPRRRLFIFKAAAVLGGAATLGLSAATKAQADPGRYHGDVGDRHVVDAVGDRRVVVRPWWWRLQQVGDPRERERREGDPRNYRPGDPYRR